MVQSYAWLYSELLFPKGLRVLDVKKAEVTGLKRCKNGLIPGWFMTTLCIFSAGPKAVLVQSDARVRACFILLRV